MTKKILVIGGYSFLGYNLAKKLINYNYKIYLLCKKKNFRNKLTSKKVKYIYCNILNFKQLKKSLSHQYDYVINFAGNIDHKDKNKTYQAHYQGLKNLIKILKKKKIKVFIQTGSSLEYGNNPSPQKETMKCLPISYYGRAKYLSSKFLLKNNNYNFKTIILRLYQVYGPYQKIDRLIPMVINSFLKNKSLECTDGKQKRDFIYVDDLINLFLKIIKTKKINSGIYNVGNGKSISVKNVIENINILTKKGRPIYGAIKMRKDEIENLYPSINKVKKIFNWKPHIPLARGLRKTIKFYENKN